MGEAYRRCLDIHWGRLNSIIAQLGAELAKKLGIDSLAGETAVADGKVENLNMIVTQSVMDAASGGSGDTFPDGAMSSFRNILRKKRQTDIIDTALENYDDIRNNTLKDLKAAYKSMEETALNRLDSLYQTQVNVSRDSLNHAMEMSSDISGAAMKKYLEDAAAVLTDAARTLLKYA